MQTPPAHVRTARGRRGSAAPAGGDTERGDVPGWVMVTMMTAALVVLVWTFAGPALQGLFAAAVARVSSGMGG